MAAVEALLSRFRSAMLVGNIVLDRFNDLTGSVNDVRRKTRYLEITIVNLSRTQRLVMEDSWFDVGRFWSQPFGSIMPGQAKTFFVCNGDGTMFTGVSGGIGLRVYNEGSNAPFEEGGNGWWICTFSDPYMGVNKCLTRWKDYGIVPLWNQMHQVYVVQDSRCGCYRKDNKHFVFLWKDPDTNW